MTNSVHTLGVDVLGADAVEHHHYFVLPTKRNFLYDIGMGLFVSAIWFILTHSKKSKN